MSFLGKIKMSESGFSLLEVLVSSLVLLAVAAGTYQVLPYPRQRIAELEERADIVRYMDKTLVTLRDEGVLTLMRRDYCTPQVTCDPNVCGPEVCNTKYAEECGSQSIEKVSASDPLSMLVSNHNSVCFAHAILDTGCDPALNNESSAKQVCMLVKWPKKQGGMAHEILTAFIFKP